MNFTTSLEQLHLNPWLPTASSDMHGHHYEKVHQRAMSVMQRWLMSYVGT